MKRLAVVIPEYRTEVSGGGGVASVAEFLLSAFDVDKDWSVDVISPRMSHSAEQNRRIFSPRTWFSGPTVSTASVDGRLVTYVGSNWSEIEAMRYRPRRVLTKILGDYDAILSVSGTPAMCFALSAAGVPIVSQVATLVKEERRRLIRTTSGLRNLQVRLNTWATSRLERASLEIPTVLVVENSWMLNACASRGKPTVLQSPGVDTNHFVPGAKTKVEEGYFLMVGRLNDPRKDLPTLLHAYADAKHRHGVRQSLIIAGRYAPNDGDLALIAQLGLSDSVSVRTNLPSDELVKLYQEADLFVLSSEEEGLGMVILEAMACGIPAVATATEGARHIISSSDVGALVEFGKDLSVRLSDAMSRYAKDASLRERVGARARIRVESHFSLASAGARFRQIVDSSTRSVQGPVGSSPIR